MLKIIGIVIVILIIVFVIFVSTRPAHFQYERSGIINASVDKIFPYLSTFEGGHKWSPYERMDPNMKTKIIGPDGQVGTVMEFEGNRDAGSGKLEFLKITAPTEVNLKLTMIKPFPAENLIVYHLSANEGGGTKFTWSMSGDNGFLGKMMVVFIDCEKLIGGQMEQGIKNLKEVVEK
ncbi:MAG TPA: SRPBCC family protein [Bdellovibrio sp.]|uniref:SRPBCC family protein n=1 Tax=Bdellovibrio sp. TaxID=28201 RepID=UPI002F02B30E